jgi:hypothetical protein
MILHDDVTAEMTRIISLSGKVDAEMVPIPIPDRPRRNKVYVVKAGIPRYSPYEKTVFLDSDTLIDGPIDDLFGKLEDNPAFVTKFAKWVTTGNKMRKRVNGWDDISPTMSDLVARAVGTSYPALNTGVLGWQRGASILTDWLAATQAGAGKFIADEIGMQLVYTDHDHILLDDRWNCSPIYGECKQDAIIWHFHGRKHLKNEHGRKLWEPAFRECMAQNVAEIRDWAGQYDTEVKTWLEETNR